MDQDQSSTFDAASFLLQEWGEEIAISGHTGDACGDGDFDNVADLAVITEPQPISLHSGGTTDFQKITGAESKPSLMGPSKIDISDQDYQNQSNSLDTDTETSRVTRQSSSGIKNAAYSKWIPQATKTSYYKNSRKCNICGKKFARFRDHQAHVEERPLRPYRCGYCCRRFRFQHYLLRHVTLHTIGKKVLDCIVSQVAVRLDRPAKPHANSHFRTTLRVRRM